MRSATHEIQNLVSLSLDIKKTISLAKLSKLIFNSNIAKEVWVYAVDSHNNILIWGNKPFKSLGETSAPQKSDTIWVYKKFENNLVLLYDKLFSSINQINKVLNISNHTIKKDLVLHNFCCATQ